MVYQTNLLFEKMNIFHKYILNKYHIKTKNIISYNKV